MSDEANKTPTEPEIDVAGLDEPTPDSDIQPPDMGDGDATNGAFKSKWVRVGKGATYAVLAALATYGAAKPDGQHAANKAQVSTEVAYDKNAKDIDAIELQQARIIKELANMREWGKAVSVQVRADFKAETAGLRQYIMGYTAALSRMAASGTSSRKINEVVSQVIKNQAAVTKQADEDSQAAAADQRRIEARIRSEAAKELRDRRMNAAGRKAPPSLRSLIKKRGGYQRLLRQKAINSSD